MRPWRSKACRFLLGGVALTLGVMTSAVGGTIRVPADEASITKAVAGAAPGDTIAISPGTYSYKETGEKLPVIVTMPLVIMGVGDPSQCVMVPDGTEWGPREREVGCFIVRDVGEGEARFRGLTFRSAGVNDAGFDIYRARAVLEDCRFYEVRNAVRVAGDGEARITDCLFEDAQLGVSVMRGRGHFENNRLIRCKHGITFNWGQGVARGNRIVDATANGIAFAHSDSVLVEENYIEGSTQCGIGLRWSSPLLSRNELMKNNYGIWCSDGSAPRVVGNVVSQSRGYDLGCERDASPSVGGSLAEANDFSGDGVFLIFNLTEYAIDCRWNYWGTECPTADRFEGPVKFSPWTNPDHDQELTSCP